MNLVYFLSQNLHKNTFIAVVVFEPTNSLKILYLTLFIIQYKFLSFMRGG